MKNYYFRFQRTIFISALIFLASTSLLDAQITTKGKDFWLGFLQNYSGSGQNPDSSFVFISSDVNANVKLSAPLNGWSQDVVVAANSTLVVQIPNSVCYNSGSETIQNTGINVSSDVEINVFQMEYQKFTTDGSIALPTHTLGNEYIVGAYTPSLGPSEILIIAPSDNTTVEITPTTATLGGHAAGTPFTITLNRGQCYQVQSSGDLTGSLVSSINQGNKPFVVYSGNTCVNIPVHSPVYTACDHISEVMYPIKTWGKKYVTTPLYSRTGAAYRIVASKANTEVKIDGVTVATLGRSQFYEAQIVNPSYISANNPIMVLQYSNSTQVDGILSDPFMISLSPTNQMRTSITFHVFNFNSIPNNFLNIVTYTSNVSSLRLDGVDISSKFAPVPGNPSISFDTMRIGPGAHNLVSNSNLGFNAYVYGFGQTDSYGYSAGARLDTLLMTVTQNSKGLCAGVETEFSAQPAWPVSSYKWNFGDGSSSTAVAPKHTFASGGDYDVELIVNSFDQMESDTSSKTITITEAISDLSFTGAGCNNFDVDFIDKSTAIKGKIVQWDWDFGDGQKSTVQTPSHKYGATGTFVTSLTVTTAEGCTSTDTTVVKIFPLPNPVIKASDTTVFCTCDSVILDAGIGFTKYVWSTNANSRLITVRQTGNYTVTVTDTNGCVNTSKPMTVTVLEPSAIISLPKDTLKAATGNEFTFPMYIESSKYLDFCKIRNFTALLSFNKTMLYPTDNQNSTKDANKRYITVTGTRSSTDTILFSFKMISTLGDAESTPITIDTISFPDCPFVAVRKGTNFATSNLCYAGGTPRLFYWNGTKPQLNILPNPSTDKSSIEYLITEPTQFKIYITDMLGRIVKEVISGEAKKGEYSINLDTSEMSPGSYIVVLFTPENVATKMLEVQK
jgi:PKD repeat protein